MDIDDYTSLNLYETDIPFQKPFRLITFGSSDTGKSYLVQNLIRLHHEKIHKIILSGVKNELLSYPETKNKTVFHPDTGDEESIFNPFPVIEELQEGNSHNKQILCIYDDLLEHVFKSPIISKLFSKGRHDFLSVIIVMQSYFPKYSGINLSTQIKNNSSIQIFTRSASMSEVTAIASRLEFGTKYKTFFLSLYKKLIQSRRYGYLVVFLNNSDERIKYCSNLLDEDGSGFLTVYSPTR